MKYKYLIGALYGNLPSGKKLQALAKLASKDMLKLLDEASVEPYIASWKEAVRKLNEEHPRTKPWSVGVRQDFFSNYHYVEINCPGYTGCYVSLTVIAGEWMPF